jgi:peptidoglycan/LPS O-acetylase OafA/YrhL
MLCTAANTAETRAHFYGYRPDVDGLRALAVLAVLLFHADLGCPGGFVGVDVFFVISGFLITSLLLREIDDGTFSLVAFWERRIRRILPAMALTVLATIIGGYCIYLPKDLDALGKSVVAQGTLLSNVFFWRQAGYFGPASDTKPLLHTWSLAVEEQFYLLFPAFLMIAVRRGKRLLSITMACLALASFISSVVGSRIWPEATFYFLPTRACELLLGALLVSLRGQMSLGLMTKEVLGWLGAGLVLYAILFYDRDTRFPGWAALAPCLGTALIILSSESEISLLGRILALKPVVFIGLISYSLYLLHWPLLVFSEYMATEPLSKTCRIAILVSSATMAILSWRYIETPFRKRRILSRGRQAFHFAWLSMTMLVTLGLLVHWSHGFPQRLSPEALRFSKGRNDRAFRNEVSLDEARAGRFAELGPGDPTQPVRILIWGDSHAMAIAPVLDELCRRFSMRGIEATHSVTPPILGYTAHASVGLGEKTPAFVDSVLSFISSAHVEKVILAADWLRYPHQDSMESNLLGTVRALTARGAKVYVVKDVPKQTFNAPRIVAMTAMHHGDLDRLGLSQELHAVSDRKLRATFDQIAQIGATVLDPAPYFLNHNGLYAVVRNGRLLYWDYGHLTPEGSRLLAPLFEPLFRKK